MSSQPYSNKQHLYVKHRSINLERSQLLDQIGGELLDHLISCRTCSAIFADQKNSIGEAGCVLGQRIVSESQKHRSRVAPRHVTEETLDDYLFERLTGDQREAVERHAQLCSQCGRKIVELQTLITCMKLAFRDTAAPCEIVIESSTGSYDSPRRLSAA
jgi:hypothetical protein